MPDTSTIYERIMLRAGFGKMKYFRDTWNYSPDNSKMFNRIELCELSEPDYSEYEFIIKETRAETRETIEQTVIALMKAYNKEFIPVSITWENMRAISSESMEEPDMHRMPGKGQTLAFISNGILYIFRESGIAHFLSQDAISALKKEHEFRDYAYVLLVEGDAFSEVLNHNNNEKDPSRGMQLLSLQFFFDLMFGPEEYPKFKEYYDKLVTSVRNYFGLAIVKTLRPNSLYSYKKTVREHLHEFDFSGHEQELSNQNHISAAQRQIIEQQFFDAGYFEALTSKCEFAKCFMTAEWLYDSFHETAGSIDLTAISMGYFKALEQFMYKFTSFHTVEKDGPGHQISLGYNKPWEPFTDELHERQKKNITLGTLAKFLKNRCTFDMLRSEIDQNTIEFLRDVLSRTTDQRNGYFHKDNIDDWDKVEKDRNLTYTVFYLLLGGYKYGQDEKEALGIEKIPPLDDYEKLCQYMHRLSFNLETLELPVLYINEPTGEHSEYDFYYPNPDNDIEYNKYGEPTYSGIYVRRMQGPVFKLDRDHMPNVVQEGKLVISRDVPIKFELSGPQVDIFREGRFLIDVSNE